MTAGIYEGSIVITIHLVNGESFVRSLPLEHAEDVQDFMDWYRRPGKVKVWAWHVPTAAQIHMLHHDHILAVDIDGYIEPDGRPSRWYERIADRMRAFRATRMKASPPP